jgi:two-component system, NtrC family, response regulator AtoC
VWDIPEVEMQSEYIPAGTILVGDDDPEVRRYLAMALRYHGFQVEFAEDGIEVVEYLRRNEGRVSALLLDILMPRMDGMQALRELRLFNRALPVIVLSCATSPTHVVEAMKSGATDYLVKPVTHEELCGALAKVLNGDWKQRQPPPQDSPGTVKNGAFFTGTNRSRALEAFLQKVGPTDAPVLIQGETGTGKEVVARYLHSHSKRANKPFLKLNCAAVPSELIESELFGYERGAFTGAFQKKAGIFELADGGTLLLDEIGDMDFRLQSKLLQVLQDQSFQHLGGKETIHVNVRVLAATHRDLERAIAEGKFREDLYYRLNVICIHVPPLRERQDEIMPLAEFLLRRHLETGSAPPALSPDLQRALMEYHWPGNVRELENIMRRYLILRDPNSLTSELRGKSLQLVSGQSRATVEVFPAQADTAADRILDQVRRAKDQAEIQAIVATLKSTGWNRKQAAALLDLDYKALLYKMKKLGIEKPPASQAGAGRPRPPATRIPLGSEHTFREEIVSAPKR